MLVAGGPVHHEPRAAGVFIPGVAQSQLADPDLPNLMRQRTLTLGQSDSMECLGDEVTPRRMNFTPGSSQASLASPVGPPPVTPPPKACTSPAPTTLDYQLGTFSVSSQLSPIPPDNQLGDTQLNPPTPPFCSPPAPGSIDPHARSQALTPEGSLPQTLTSSLQLAQATPHAATPQATPPQTVTNQSTASSSGGGTDAPELEGTMYTDGTYWKTLDRNICFF